MNALDARYASHGPVAVDGVALDQGAVGKATALVPQADLTGCLTALGLVLAGFRRVYLLGRPTPGAGTAWLLGRAEKLQPSCLSVYPELGTAAQFTALTGLRADHVVEPWANGHGAAGALVASGVAADRALLRVGHPGVTVPPLPAEVLERRPDTLSTRVLLVGAGSAGTAFLVGLLAARWQSELGEVTVHLLDHDGVEARNLNRCLLWDKSHLDSPKVHAVHGTLATVATAHGLRVTVSPERFSPAAASAFRPRVVVCAVDNYRARAEVNAWATEQQVPLVELGCSPYSARAEVCVPRASACLRERLRVDERAVEEVVEAAGGCGRRTDGALVGSNVVAAGLALQGMLRLLRKEPPRGALRYDLLQGTRGEDRPKATCTCWGAATSG